MSTASIPTITLEIRFVDRPAETRVITAARTLIGRESGDIVLRDAEASALHAEVDCSQGQVIIRDLGSSNGTWREGKRLPQFALYEGQTFRCGATDIRLVSIEGTDSPKPGGTAIGKRDVFLGSSSTLPATGEQPTSSGGGTIVGPPPRPGPPAKFQPPPSPIPPVETTHIPGGAPPPASGISPQPVPGVVEPVPELPTPAPVVVESGAAPIEAIPTEPSGGVAVTPPSVSAPVGPRGPVANAVIKGPAAPSGAPRPIVPAAPRRGAGRVLKLIAVVAFGATVVAAAVVGAYLFLAARSLGFATQVASELPDDAPGFFAVSSAADLVELLGEEVPEAATEVVSQRIGFSPFDPEAYTEVGFDPDAPIAVSVVRVDPPIFAFSVGVDDRELATSYLQEKLALALGEEKLEWSERDFGDERGLWLDEPVGAAALFEGDRLFVVTSSVADADDVHRAAVAIAGREDGKTLADRPGFGGVVPPPGRPLAMVYADGGAIRNAVNLGGAKQIVTRMALAHFEGFAAILSDDGPRIHVSAQTVMREGSRQLELVDGIKRDTAILDQLPAPVLAEFDVAVAPEAYEAQLDDVFTVGGIILSLVEDEIRREGDIDLRGDVLRNLAGNFGIALTSLPTSADQGDFGAIGWLGVEDEKKAIEVAEKLYALGAKTDAIKSEQVGDATVYSFLEQPRTVSYFIRDSHVFGSVGEVDLRPLVDGDAESFRKKPRHKAIVAATKKGGFAAGFADIQELRFALRPILDEGEREMLDRFAAIIDPIEVVTVRGEAKGRTSVGTFTVHTNVDHALATLLQAALATYGDEVAKSLAIAARRKKCIALSEHLFKLADDVGGASAKLWDAERRVQELCANIETDEAIIDCFLGARSLSAVEACESGEEEAAPPVEPKLVPYVADIWPNTVDDPDSERPQSEVNYGVGVGENPQFRGSDDALVTIVEFANFQCPHCRDMVPSLDRILAARGDEVRVVFRHMPLPAFDKSTVTARAAIAAGKQGKFWKMHDVLFARSRALDEASVRGYAEELGLDMVQFDRDYYDTETASQLDEDRLEAERFGVTGTPSFFVNGRFLGGTQSEHTLNRVIDEERARALLFVKKRGDTKVRLYDDMIEHFASEVLLPRPVPTEESEKRYSIPTDGLPVKGTDTLARVNIVECGDFDCPYCRRSLEVIEQILDEYPTQVSFYWAHYPLPLHPGAEPAARAATAADAQGKFWEMHDLLFKEPSKRTEGDFKRAARKLKLDVKGFETDFAAEETAEKVARQRKSCLDADATGTPTFYVNGRKLSGAPEFERLKAIVDEELSRGI